MDTVWIILEGFSYEGIQEVDSVWPSKELAELRLEALKAITDDGSWYKMVSKPVGR